MRHRLTSQRSQDIFGGQRGHGGSSVPGRGAEVGEDQAIGELAKRGIGIDRFGVGDIESGRSDFPFA